MKVAHVKLTEISVTEANEVVEFRCSIPSQIIECAGIRTPVITLIATANDNIPILGHLNIDNLLQTTVEYNKTPLTTKKLISDDEFIQGKLDAIQGYYEDNNTALDAGGAFLPYTIALYLTGYKNKD